MTAAPSSRIAVHHGDCLDVLRTLPDGSFDSCVTDPPYALVSIVKRFGQSNAAPAKGDVYARASRGFMGQTWDTGERAFAVELWAEVLRVLKPGAHVLAFGGTRTYHRLACAIEDAGFEIRDQIGWLYGTGFPKSHDVSKAIDKASGAERKITGEVITTTEPATDAAKQWAGWGTALKPAWEPIVMARKPLIGSVAANVMEHGTGAINIDWCRVKTGDNLNGGTYAKSTSGCETAWQHNDRNNGKGSGLKNSCGKDFVQPGGRHPANIIHDGSADVLDAFAVYGEAGAQLGGQCGKDSSGGKHVYNGGWAEHKNRAERCRNDTGTAARFFYSAKADAGDRLGSKHPTVKPVDLMAYLCRLVTTPGGRVLDMFAGSGTTGMACLREGFSAVLIEREAEYVADIKRRIEHVQGTDTPLFTTGDTQ